MKVKSLNKKLIFILPIIALIGCSIIFSNNISSYTTKTKQYNSTQVGITLLFPVPDNISRGNKLLYGLTDGDDVYNADGAIFSWYGPRPSPTEGASTDHKGIDIGFDGMQVVAAQEGTVTFSGANGGFGYHVEIQHQGGYMTSYSHMTSDLLVSVGQQIRAGEPVGFVGNTGTSSGAHLDFRVYVDGVADFDHAVDPAQFFNLDLSSKTGVIATGELYNPANGGGSQGGNSGNGKKNTIKLTPQAWAYYASYATKPVEAAPTNEITSGVGVPGGSTNINVPKDYGSQLTDAQKNTLKTKKVFICPSVQTRASGNGTAPYAADPSIVEGDFMQGTMYPLIKAYLEKLGVSVQTYDFGQNNWYSHARPKSDGGEVDDNTDALVALHSDGGNGSARGQTVLFNTEADRLLGEYVLSSVKNLYIKTEPEPPYRMRESDDQETLVPPCPAIILEIAFHDNLEDSKWLIEKKQQIAEAISSGIIAYLIR